MNKTEIQLDTNEIELIGRALRAYDEATLELHPQQRELLHHLTGVMRGLLSALE